MRFSCLWNTTPKRSFFGSGKKMRCLRWSAPSWIYTSIWTAPLMSELLFGCVCVVHYCLRENRTEKYLRELPYHIMLNFHVPCQSLHVLQSRVLAGVRCADAQTLQAYSLVCPGKDPREQVHLAHMLGALWLFGLLCADWLGLQRYFFSPPFPF